jgi:hypothetical protein
VTLRMGLQLIALNLKDSRGQAMGCDPTGKESGQSGLVEVRVGPDKVGSVLLSIGVHPGSQLVIQYLP